MKQIGALWAAAVSDEARAELLQAIYERIVVSRDGFIEVTLTPHAYGHGLALALPETVRLHKRPRQDPAPPMQSIIRIAVAGKGEWNAAARRLA